MFKKLFAIFVMLTLLTSFSMKNVSADTPFQADQFPYKDMQIQVMPEFDYPADWPKDTPSLLIGQYGTMTNKSGQDYDGKIEIPVPAKDKDFQLYLVAEFPDANKPEVQRPYDVDKEKGVVSWKPAKPIPKDQTYRYVIEYYVNSISVSDQKKFTYNFTNQADIETLDVIFYSPMNAKNIALEPAAQNQAKNEYGEELYYYQYKNFKKGNILNYSFSYKKANNDSTLSVMNKQQKNTQSSTTKAGATDKAVNKGEQPIITIGGASVIGVSILAAGLFVFFGLRGRPKTAAVKKSSGSVLKNKKKSTKMSNEKKGNIFVNNEEKKVLRKKLLNGKIDQETYEEEMKKLL